MEITIEQGECVHYYLIPGRGVKVIGTCKKCGYEKEFYNNNELNYRKGGWGNRSLK